ncbi:hypothetical protein N7519_007713 [Penicillium mononematosum]|uniref:uncharacterized protein n=1 Tax=Penicillium mononematosum TaxID=268346 RepID=UPI0025483B1A|nr:uncharacterized protein N7519_007713 [Penicillium mononematosum]KAJ6186412.1 hypothetical protein N7519_007713 [Penicillium mononematosum]
MASVNTSVIFDLGGSHYLARPIRMPTNRESFLENGFKSKIPSLVTYFSVWNTHTIDAGALQKWRAEYLDQDDVFQPKFLQGIIFGGVESNEVQLTRDAETLLEVWKTVSVVYEPHLELKDGPYYITGGTFHSTWQIYEDRQLAFLQETWPTDDGNGTVEQVNAPGNGYRSHEIAIPARYYSQNIIEPDPTVKKNHTPSPLHGMRVAIKDNFHISGTKTSLGNLAYYETYSVRNDTADVVLELLDAGVHIVGKMHLSPFAMMEHLMQSVDYQAPFNPRGGGYLIAGGE